MCLAEITNWQSLEKQMTLKNHLEQVGPGSLGFISALLRPLNSPSSHNLFNSWADSYRSLRFQLLLQIGFIALYLSIHLERPSVKPGSTLIRWVTWQSISLL